MTGGLSLRAAWREAMNVDFWAALEFTLLHTAAATPSILILILILGLALALGVDRLAKPLKGAAIFVALLPMIVTPVVSALSICWLFLDGAVVTSALEWLGLGWLHFLADQATIRALFIGHGIWFVAPFAFILFRADLQTVPADPLEAAIVDGRQRLAAAAPRDPAPSGAPGGDHHADPGDMDAYRLFEPILVFGSAVHANSVQHLTYDTLAFEDSANKAAASAILTAGGVVVIPTPMLIRQRREYRVGR